VNDSGGAAKTVHLHIGTMKTGTSYVQGNLEHSRHALARAGVLYPGSVGAAVHEVLEKHGARHVGDTSGAWDELASKVRAWDGSGVIVSMEFLTLASSEQAQRIVASLQPADVRIVLTVRDLSRTIPSAWQQTTKNRQTASWSEFLAALTADAVGSERTREQFWRHHDLARITRTWSGVVGPDRMTVVTLPPRDSPSTVLWERFCAATGLDSADYPVAETSRSNSSLGFAEAEMMRRLNLELGRDVDQASYRRLVTGLISRRLLRRGAEPTPAAVLPVHVHEWAVQRSNEAVSDLRALGVRVVGDLTELVPPPVGDDQRAFDDSAAPVASTVAESDVATVAVRAVAALVTRLAELGDAEARGGGHANAGEVGERRGGRGRPERRDQPEVRAERQAVRRAARAVDLPPA